jgi:hypothetical protein
MTRRRSVLPLLLFDDVLRFTWHVFLVLLFLVASGCQANDIPVDINPMVRGNVLLQVYVVRHAESKKNVVHLPGTPEEQLDTLTTKGREQAAAIGHFLKDKDLLPFRVLRRFERVRPLKP